MPQKTVWMACFVVALFGAQAHAQFSIRAASDTAVDGWEQMPIENCQSQCLRWVSPTAAIVASDIEKAQPQVRVDGDRVIGVTMTDTGAEKLRAFTEAQ